MTQQVLALKWRPRTFNEVIGQPHVVQALSNGLDNDRLHHAFLFTGTRGVGKTTLARIFAKSLNCEKGVSSTPCGECSICLEVDEGRFVDLIEIDAASRTRVEDTREILDNVQYAPTRGRYKIYLIDEVHMLSNSSFNALLKTLEEPPSHVKFLLATTDPQKLPVTVLSRCLRFQLKRIQDQEIAGQLETILTSEGIPFELDALKLIAKAGDGSMRDALSLLDQAIAYSGQNVQFKLTHEMLGLIDTQYLIRVLEALATKKSTVLLEAFALLKSHGLDYYRFLEDLIDAFHVLTMIQLSPEMGEKESLEMNALAEKFAPEDLQLFYQVALNGRKDLHNHPNSEVGFEMTLLRMVLFAPTAPIGVIEAQKKSSIANNEDAFISKANITGQALNPIMASKESPVIDEDINSSVDLSGTKDSLEMTPALNDIQVQAEIESIATLEISADEIIEIDIPTSNEKVDLPWEDSLKETNEPEPLVEEFFVAPEAPIFEITETAVTTDSVINTEVAKSVNADLNIESDLAGDLNPQDSAREAAPYQGARKDAERMIEVETEHSFSDTSDNWLMEDRPVFVEDGPKISAPIPKSDNLVSILLNNNEEWLSLVAGLTLESVLSGIAHSLVFKSFDGVNLVLERPLSVKDFRVDEAEMRLAMAISARLGVDVSCRIEYVETLDVENLHERTERLDEERLQQALNSFKQDDVVQYMEQELGAVLLTKTLKPFDKE